MFLINLSLIILVGLFLTRRLDQLISKYRVDIFSPWLVMPAAYAVCIGFGCMNLPGYIPPVPIYIAGFNLLGLAALLAGLYLGKLIFGKEAITYPGIVENQLDPERINKAVFFLSVTGFIALGLMFSKHGIPVLSPDVDKLRIEIYDNAYLAFFSFCLYPAFVFLLINPSPVKSLAAGIIIIALLATGSRAWPLHPIIITIIARHYICKRQSLNRLYGFFLAAGAFISVTVFLRMKETVYVAVVLSQRLEGLVLSFVRQLYAELHIVQELFYRLTLVFPSTYPYQKGKCFWMLALSILPGEQESPALFVSRILGMEKVGFGPAVSALGNFYIDGGLIGIIAGMTATGFISIVIYRLIRGKAGFIAVIIYAVWLDYFFISLRTGFCFDTVYFWIFLLFLAVYFYSRKVKWISHS